MAIQNMEELVVHLPPDLVDRVRQTAARRHQGTDEVVSEILRISLPHLKPDVEAELRSRIAQQSRKTAEELLRAKDASLASKDADRLSDLLTRNREGTLTAQEEEELESLLDKVEDAAIDRSVAEHLLSQTGT